MISPVVNALAIVLGSVIGLILKKGIPEHLTDSMMKALGLCVIYVGITGILQGNNTLVILVSMVIGTLIGESVDLDLRIRHLGDWVETKVKRVNNDAHPVAEASINDTSSINDTTSIAEGFVTATLLFAVGAMAIVGSLQSGLTGNHEMIFTKSIIDFIVAIIFASTKGIGVVFSAIAILLYQGSIVLLSSWMAPLLTDVAISEMTAVGSLVILALGLNMLNITKIKVMNLVPSIFLPILFVLFM